MKIGVIAEDDFICKIGVHFLLLNDTIGELTLLAVHSLLEEVTESIGICEHGHPNLELPRWCVLNIFFELMSWVSHLYPNRAFEFFNNSFHCW